MIKKSISRKLPRIKLERIVSDSKKKMHFRKQSDSKGNMHKHIKYIFPLTKIKKMAEINRKAGKKDK
jgi:hypothetical protein